VCGRPTCATSAASLMRPFSNISRHVHFGWSGCLRRFTWAHARGVIDSNRRVEFNSGPCNLRRTLFGNECAHASSLSRTSDLAPDLPVSRRQGSVQSSIFCVS